jgi:uncharacterized protein (DUF433 family)
VGEVLKLSASGARPLFTRKTSLLVCSSDSCNTSAMKTWIVADADHLGGRPRIRDTRISVAQVLECLAAGMSINEIVDAYPSLTDEAVRGVLAELAKEHGQAAA